MQTPVQNLSSLGRLVLACAFAVSAPAWAVSDADYQRAYAVMQRAQAGDKSVIPEAVDGFAELVKAEPSHPALLAQLGAATAMQSRTTMLPWKKISFAEDGMALQDRAVGLLKPEHEAQSINGVPISLSVRFVAASTWLAVPSFFNRGDRGQKLLAELLQNPLLDTAPLQFRGAVWLRAARLAEDQKLPDDAKKWLGQVISTGAPQADQARDKLNALAH